jgi:MFS family permease
MLGHLPGMKFRSRLLPFYMGNFISNSYQMLLCRLTRSFFLCASSFACGAYVALLPNPMVEFGTTEDVGRRMGMFMTIFALGALAGPPISGAINAVTGGFEAVGYYAGMCSLITPFGTGKYI